MTPEASVKAERVSYLRPGHLAPLLVHLATQTSAGETGLVIDSVRWNRDHGLGDAGTWRYRPA